MFVNNRYSVPSHTQPRMTYACQAPLHLTPFNSRPFSSPNFFFLTFSINVEPCPTVFNHRPIISFLVITFTLFLLFLLPF